MTYVFDLDGTLCATEGREYEGTIPIVENIARLNRLHAQGHRIIICTARGTLTGRDWRKDTERQLARWGVQYDELHFGKPYGDVYVDDKAVRPFEPWPGETG